MVYNDCFNNNKTGQIEKETTICSDCPEVSISATPLCIADLQTNSYKRYSGKNSWESSSAKSKQDTGGKAFWGLKFGF